MIQYRKYMYNTIKSGLKTNTYRGLYTRTHTKQKGIDSINTLQQCHYTSYIFEYISHEDVYSHV